MIYWWSLLLLWILQIDALLVVPLPPKASSSSHMSIPVTPHRYVTRFRASHKWFLFPENVLYFPITLHYPVPFCTLQIIIELEHSWKEWLMVLIIVFSDFSGCELPKGCRPCHRLGDLILDPTPQPRNLHWRTTNDIGRPPVSQELQQTKVELKQRKILNIHGKNRKRHYQPIKSRNRMIKST